MPTDHAHPEASTPTTPLTSRGGRQLWTLTEAANRTNVSRSTLRRRLADSAFPGAVLDPERGWLVGVDDLLGAGIELHRPIVEDTPTPLTVPAQVADPLPTDRAHVAAPAHERAAHDTAHPAHDTGRADGEIERLTAALAAAESARAAAERIADAERRRAEQEQHSRELAELRLEATERIATERERALERADLALRALTAGPSSAPAPSTTAPPVHVVDVREQPVPTAAPTPEPPAATPASPLGRVRRWLGGR